MRVTVHACARTYLPQCVVSESECFSRRPATPQDDKGSIDCWTDGSGKNCCKREDLNKIAHTETTLPTSK